MTTYVANRESTVLDFEDTGSEIFLVLHQQKDKVDSQYDKGSSHSLLPWRSFTDTPRTIPNKLHA